MKSHRFQFRNLLSPIIIVTLMVGVGVHLVGYFGIEIVWRPIEKVSYPEPYIQIESDDRSTRSRVEQEYALLHDSAPLFVPTRWNYLSRSEYAGYSLPEYGVLFDAFPARISVASIDYNAFVSDSNRPIRRIEDVLAFSEETFFEGFGVQDTYSQRSESLRLRSAAYAIYSIGSGEAVDSGDLAPESLPGLNRIEWRPVEMLLVVNNIGMVGRPLPVSSSGSESIDRQLSDWLIQSGLVTQLPPGYYRVVIGP